MKFEVTSKCPFVFVKLTLENVCVVEVTVPPREIDIRYEFDLKEILMDLASK